MHNALLIHSLKRKHYRDDIVDEFHDVVFLYVPQRNRTQRTVGRKL